MAPRRDLTHAERLRLESAPFLSLVAYFHPRPPAVGDLIAAILSLSRTAFGDLRVSGEAGRNRPWSAEDFAGLRAAEIRSRMFRKMPGTFQRIESDSAIVELNTGELCEAWIHRMSKHKESGLSELVWHLKYSSVDVQHSTNLDPYVHLSLVMDRHPWTNLSRRRFVEQFFELCAATGSCYGGLVDFGRWRELMGRSYHDFTAGSVSLDRLINSYQWIRLGDRRRNFIRGVYWGTLLPAWVIERLGGHDLVRANWTIDGLDFNFIHPRFVDLAGGAALLTLTNEPGDLRSGYMHHELDKAAWLCGALRDAGLLM